MQIAVIVDDLAVDRQLASYVLERAGWKVLLARNSSEGHARIESVVQAEQSAHTVIITDLDMPNDPINNHTDSYTRAGSHFALQLRARMERQEIPRMPIIALTALTQREILVTARAFGCDVVLPKPATLDLAERVMLGLSQVQHADSEDVGSGPLLQLLRLRLAHAIGLDHVHTTQLTEQDITRALLSYRRDGLVGLGESSLARRLAPQFPTAHARGKHTYDMLVAYLDEIMILDSAAALSIVRQELVKQASPAEQCVELSISLSEYYRRRHEAILTLLDLLTKKPLPA